MPCPDWPRSAVLHPWGWSQLHPNSITATTGEKRVLYTTKYLNAVGRKLATLMHDRDGKQLIIRTNF